ncbi:MAG: CoxG family protein [Thermoprotei archaeon]
MKVQGSVDLSPLSEDAIWRFVSDIDKVSRCFPGLKSIEKVSENTYKVTGQISVGLIKGEYNAEVLFTKIDQATKTISFNAKGKGMNSVVELVTNLKVAGSKLDYDTDVKLSGVLASLASRVLNPIVSRILEGLASCVKESLKAS